MRSLHQSHSLRRVSHPLRLTSRAFAFVLVAALSACITRPVDDTGAEGQLALTGDVLAFTNVSVIPMDTERVLTGQTVIVNNGRIVAMSSTLRPPAGARVVDGSGRYLVPGIAEMHAHIPPPNAGAELIERTLFLYVAAGVTTIRGMLGNPGHLELRERAARDEILSPRIYTSGPSLNGNSAPTPEVATRMVEAQHAAGYDLLKLHPGLSREVYDAIVATAQRVGIPYAGHVSGNVGLDRTLQARQASIDHLDSYVEALAGQGGGFDPVAAGFFGFGLLDQVEESRIPQLARATREAGVWNAPTQTLIEHLFNTVDPNVMAQWPEMRYMPPATVANWVRQKQTIQQQANFTRERADRYIAVRRRLIRELHSAGAGIILASDAPQWWNVPGFSAHRELGMMVDAGLTPWQALETGTRNAAAYFGPVEWGVIAPGRVADMILLDANPLTDIENISRIAGVVVRGRWLPQGEIRERLDRIAAEVAGQ
jgi:imidazolonepropionase-like amidohydrolase